MRRREQAAPARRQGVPIELTRYSEADWSGPMVGFTCEHPECRYWEARGRWLAEHPGAELAGDGPDTPFHPERV